MADVVLEISAEDRDAQRSFDSVLSELQNLGVVSQRVSQETIADSRRVSTERIREAERTQRLIAQAESQRVRDLALVDRRRLQDVTGISSEERRIRQRAIADNLRSQQRAIVSERDLNLQRLRNARETINDISRRETALLRQRQLQSRQSQAAINRITNAYRRLRTGLLSITSIQGGISIFAAGREIITAALEVDTLRNTLIALTGSVGEANRRLAEFRNLARLPGISFESAARAGIQFDNVNLSMRQTIALTRELGNVAALSGVRLEDLSFNISQLISAGEFNQRDLRESLNRAPIIGRAFGSTVAEEINSALEQSGQNIADFITARLGTLARADVNAASNVFNNFRIALRDLAAQIGQLALPALTREIRELTEYIQNNTEQIVSRIEGTVNNLTTAFGILIRNINNLGNLLQAGAFVAGFLGLANFMRRATAQIVLLGSSAAKTSGTIRGLGTAFLGLSAAEQVRNLTGINRVLTLIGVSATRLIGIVSGVGLAISGVFLLKDLVSFIFGIRSARDAMEELENTAVSTADAIAAVNSELANISNFSLESARAELDNFNELLIESFRDIRRNLAGQESLTGQIAPELAELGDDRRIQGLGRFIENIRERREELTEELNALRRGTTAGSQQRFEVRTQFLVGNIQEIDAALELLNRLFIRRDALQDRINRGLGDTATASSAAAQRSAQQIQADATLFSNRLRLLGEFNRQQQIARERESELDLQQQEAAAARQQAIAQDMGRRALAISRQGIADLRNQETQQARQTLSDFRDSGNAFLRTFRQVSGSIAQIGADISESVSGIAQNIQNEINALNIIRRGADLDLETVRRQTPEQRDIVDDFVGATPEENTRQRLRFIYDINRVEGERLNQLRLQQERQFSNLALNSALELAFSRGETFRETALQFIQQSVRIIAQNLIETQFILLNNRRLIDSYNEVNLARTGASFAGVAGVFTGNPVLGALGAVPQITNLLKVGPNEAREIGDFLNSLGRDRRD